MRSCVDRLAGPFQSHQGRLLDFIPPVIESGAVVVLSFAQSSYIIAGRAFQNARLALDALPDPLDIDQSGLDTRSAPGVTADFLPGVYDLVVIDPFGGEARQSVVVNGLRGLPITARTGKNYVQIILGFPAGEKTLSELEALVMPLNVQADWSENDTEAASFVRNKPAFLTEADFNLLLSTTVGDTIQEAVDTGLAPVIQTAQEAATAATNAAEALGDVRSTHTLAATYTTGAVVWSNVDDLPYRALTDHTGVNLDPANDAINWERISATAAQGATADAALPRAGGTMTGTLVVLGVTETDYTLTGTEISVANGTIQTKTLSGAVTLTATLANGQAVLLRLIGGNTHTVTWPTMTWSGGSAPTLTADDWVSIWKSGGTVYGAHVGSVA